MNDNCLEERVRRKCIQLLKDSDPTRPTFDLGSRYGGWETDVKSTILIDCTVTVLNKAATL